MVYIKLIIGWGKGSLHRLLLKMVTADGFFFYNWPIEKARFHGAVTSIHYSVYHFVNAFIYYLQALFILIIMNLKPCCYESAKPNFVVKLQ